jgi:hypothetical protein
MKRLPVMLAITMAVFLFSCNNEPAKEETKAADTAAAVAAPPAEIKPVFTPFKVIYIQHKVKNFATWEAAYYTHDSVRRAYGITHFIIGRDLRDSNLVYVADKMDDFEKAKTFSALPGLKTAMKAAGVISQPGFSYGEVVRSNDSATEITDRLGIAHHVKDFNAWLKAFDAEGPAVRAANGMIDGSIARSLVDSNMIYLTFVVTDMAKAKARGASPELKKIMTDAGVDSPPTMRWYRIVK